MNQKRVDSLVHTVLYEGHILHPQRADVRSRPQANALGRVQPASAAAFTAGPAPSEIQTECLVEGLPSARVRVMARFLHALERDIGELSVPMATLPAPNYPDFFHVVPALVVDGMSFASRTEAVERSITAPACTLGELRAEARQVAFQFPATRTIESIRGPDGLIVGVIVRRQEAICGALEVSAVSAGPALTRLSVRLLNTTPEPRNSFGDEEDVALRTFACAHHLLRVEGAGFVSMVEPPAAHAEAVASCRNVGTYPVLLGDPAQAVHDTALSSAVFVEDFPMLEASASRGARDWEPALT